MVGREAVPFGRIAIVLLRPRTPTGHPAKGVVGDRSPVVADVFGDGHGTVAARLALTGPGDDEPTYSPMVAVGNDRFEGHVEPATCGMHTLVIEAWTDRFGTWRHQLEARAAARDPDVDVELEVGARLLEALTPGAPSSRRPRLAEVVTTLRSATCTLDTKLAIALDDALAAALAPVVDHHDLTASKPVGLRVDPAWAKAPAWYELFPRSEGGFVGTRKRLPAVAAMGFDILYLPPIHPIGTTHRKGRGNTLVAGPDDPGSPWGIGSAAGGHTAIHAELGTAAEFRALVVDAREQGIEIALDYALQCSPDHPWVREHPEWFHHRPDGSIRYAENPPKKYQDIYPIDFWPDDDADRVALWEACRDVLEHWVGEGVRVFRVDNPHTKPFAFWEWVIGEVQSRHPQVCFLSEAFTRPKVMHALAALGFTWSYTYFTWRNDSSELREYGDELSSIPGVDYFRPSFWTNTQDILAGPLRDGPPAAFALRAVLAATMSANWGIYRGFELCENQPQSEANTEYLHSEKYELKARDWDAPDSLVPLIAALNAARRAHPALAEMATLRFHGSTDDVNLLVYSKTAPDGSDPVLVIVNLDPHLMRDGQLRLDLGAFGLGGGGAYEAHDALTGETYTWHGPDPYVRFDPVEGRVAHVLALRPVRA